MKKDCGKQQTKIVGNHVLLIPFEEWYEQNKSKIDDAILNHIKDNYPTLHSAFVIAKLAKQYDVEIVPVGEVMQELTPEMFGF